MATDRIHELKSVQFPTERRGGYDRRAVDAYLAELADWLESGGADEARRSVIQSEMERVGDRTGGVLAAAQEAADQLTSDADRVAKALRSDAEKEAGQTRSAADEYATRTRADADEYGTRVRSEADEYGVRIRAEADEQAKQKTEASARAAAELEEEAAERLRMAEQEAAERTRGIEKEIAVLVRKRRDVVANLEQLNAEMKLAIDGPGEKDLELPDRVAAEVAEPDEAPTSVSAVVEEEIVEEEIEAETDEQDVADEQAERERRRRSVDSVDPPTGDQKLTELL